MFDTKKNIPVATILTCNVLMSLRIYLNCRPICGDVFDIKMFLVCTESLSKQQKKKNRKKLSIYGVVIDHIF